jgi:hypothetical protein
LRKTQPPNPQGFLVIIIGLTRLIKEVVKPP